MCALRFFFVYCMYFHKKTNIMGLDDSLFNDLVGETNTVTLPNKKV